MDIPPQQGVFLGVLAIDFMHDSLSTGRNFRLFNVLDDFNREGLAHEPAETLTSPHA